MRHGSPADPRGSRRAQDRRAGIERSSGRSHVVDEQYTPPAHSLRIGNDERTSYVGITSFAIEVGLASSVLCAHKGAGPKGCSQAPSDRSGDEGRLIESPLGQARRVQGHRNDDVATQPAPARFEGAPKQVGQRAGQVGTPLILQSPDRPSNGPTVDKTGCLVRPMQRGPLHGRRACGTECGQ
jgi:hypothetical protein